MPPPQPDLPPPGDDGGNVLFSTVHSVCSVYTNTNQDYTALAALYVSLVGRHPFGESVDLPLPNCWPSDTNLGEAILIRRILVSS